MPAFAEEAPPGDAPAARVEEARLFLKDYLDTLARAAQAQGRKAKAGEVSKRLLATRKYLHPRTIERIAEQDKKGLVTNALAVWH